MGFDLARAARTRNLEGRGLDVLVVDDRQTSTAASLHVTIPQHRFGVVQSVAEVREFLARGEVPRVVMPDFNPSLILLDLDLGLNQPTGLAALVHLRQGQATSELPVILHTETDFSNGYRDLTAVLCAEVNGEPLLASDKGDKALPAIRTMLDRIHTGTPVPEAAKDLTTVRVVETRTSLAPNAVRGTLAGLLRDHHRELRQVTTAASVQRALGADPSGHRFTKLLRAWDASRGDRRHYKSFVELSQALVILDQHDGADIGRPQPSPAALYQAFMERYGSVIASDDLTLALDHLAAVK